MAIKATKLSLDDALKEYNVLRDNKKVIEERMKVLADLIKEESEKKGVKDENGSFIYENSSFIGGKQAKKSVNFNKEKALKFFKDRNLTKAYKEVVTEEIVESEVEKYIASEKITLEDLESITTTKVTYSVLVKQKEEVKDEVEELPLVASKKSKGKLSAVKRRR